MPKSLKKELETKTKINEETKQRMVQKIFNEEWTSYDLPNPFDVVKEFIKEKGLKLYGGLALHTHLKKHKAGLYKNYEFPDYDVLSPDAWEHAKEIANKLHEMGFMFVEARQSILNDYHHSTFKVSVDMLYLLDITQKGCTPKQIKSNDCDTCGRNKDGTCARLFDQVPAYTLNYNKDAKNPRVYRNTYNYKTGKSLYPNNFFVMNPTWLKAQMYRELSEPLSDPPRLVKIGTRLEIFKKFYDFKVRNCSKDDYKKIININTKKYLEEIANYIKNKKLINYGASAHNLFIRGNTKKEKLGTLGVSDYKVYSMNPDFHANNLLNIFNKKYPKTNFILYKRQKLWKGHEDLETIIAVKLKNKVNNLITITQHDNCMSYIQYNGIRYATLDKLKYLYYEAMSIPDFKRSVEDDPTNYECLINSLIQAEQNYKKTNKKSKRSRFRRYVSKCQGTEYNKIIGNLVDRWINKKKTLKDTKFHRNKPKPGWITKISKMSNKELFLPYKPDEQKKITKNNKK